MSQFQWSTPPSRVVRRGDVELLTFETEETVDRLDKLYQETAALTPEPGALTTLYFRSDADGSVQPYAVWLPKGFERSRRYPLVAQLHGLSFQETAAGHRPNFRGLRAETWIDPDIPAIYVQCFGRPSSFYIGIGEADVLQTIAEAARRFPVDPERVYLMGHSMGGAGSYTVGLHYPDRFGALSLADAAMGGRLAPPADLPAWMRPQSDLYLPSKLYPNARNLDVFFKNAGAGIQGRSTEFTDGIVAEGGFSTAESFPGVPHDMTVAFPYAAFVRQLIQHPIRRDPPEVKLYTTTLRYNRAYWVTVDRLAVHNVDSLVVAACSDRKAVRVTTKNIDALTLRLADAPLDKGSAPAVTVDGQNVEVGAAAPELRLSRREGKWRAGAPADSEKPKRHGVQGPVGDAFLSRFLAVYGEGDRDLAIAELDAARNPPGPLILHGEFPMKAAAKVTAEDIRTANLILFGTPKSNPLLARIAGSLPRELMREEARGVFVYPNPLNPSRYVVVWSAKVLSSPDHGLRAGWTMPLALLPDYIEVRDGKIVSGGHFDSDWRLKK
jgi:pimeloyl-ACP methyl ester carboxylesterase